MMNRPMKHKFFTALVFLLFLSLAARSQNSPPPAVTDYVAFSIQLLQAVKKNGQPEDYFNRLAAFNKDSLAAGLSTDDKRKAFWLNVYNASVQQALRKDSTLIQEKAAYTEKDMVKVAGRDLSPDFIVHRILRRSKNKYGLGYFNKLFVSDYEKQMRVEYVDYRIHFAVNNGSASCGPIDIYKETTLEDQLNWSTVFFLQQEVQYDSAYRIASLPKIMEWYKADFGGEKGILLLLRKLLIIPPREFTTLRYRQYDWTLRPGRYR
jgi:Protein of unknown function, DUF547